MFDERAPVGQLRDPVARSHREMVAAVRADPKVGVQLVVSVMRAALRARVRMLTASVVGAIAAMLDGDVDTARHDGVS
jgi:hypothetical protein